MQRDVNERAVNDRLEEASGATSAGQAIMGLIESGGAAIRFSQLSAPF